ncbi:hypothetical protein ABL78_3014 [Leptomonas seymouri]|uniref:Uncharacterized protein n=1 Tax=Leptomonas seymouri TaxID=5684 RepID=A0A0N1PDU9_LEPSE|nr:hypothetical protein ABL78_3014 [Leptomonas seymouri]|eukprot:KPI87904.1 hypothetical protein ABL78_3014 [Leptomonas seymouri]
MDRGRQTVKFYGLIYFQCKDGYLAASGLDGERLYLRTPPVVGDTADESLPFFGFADACLFRVVPTLSSLAATSSVKGASGAVSSRNLRGGVAAEENAEGTTASALSGLNDFHFDPRKTADIIDVEEITYGKSFSLVHEASGLFVGVANALPSENDPDCLSVVLVKPSAAMTPSCELSLVSRYKIHTEGDKLCRADSILIRLAASPMFLHVSSSPIMEPRGDNGGDIELLHRTFRFGSSLAYTERRHLGPGSVGVAATAAAMAAQGCNLNLQASFVIPTEHTVTALERCSTDIAAEALTREYLDEVNACEEGGVSFTIHRYDMGTDRANRQRTQLRIARPYVACGVPVALYHRERESFLMSSAAQLSGPTEVEEERDRECSNSPSPVTEDLNATSGSTVPPSKLCRVTIENAGEIDAEDGLPMPVLKSRQNKSTLNGVSAIGGAEAAIRRTTTAAAAATSHWRRRSVLSNTTSEGTFAYSLNATLQFQEQQHRARVLRTEGLIDTGRGRFFPFPVFTATKPEHTTASEDLSLLDTNHNCTTLWCFEHEEPMLGGPLRYGSSWRYRIRHVVSGMYLAVCGSAVDAMLEEDEEDNESAKQATMRNSVRTMSPASTASSTSTTAGADEMADGANGPGTSCSTSLSGRIRATAFASALATPRPAPTRETSLCLIPQPRTRKELQSTVFFIEPMYATDSAYLIEQTCLSIKNALTEMYVVTDSNVDGSNISLSLDWQPSPADPIIVSYVPHRLQLDTRFVASQCIWLARYRAEMQALVLEHQKRRSATVAAAMAGDEEAEKTLAAEEAYRSALPEMTRPYFNTADLDMELLKIHKSFVPRSSTSREWVENFSATYSSAALANNWNITGSRGGIVGFDKGAFAMEEPIMGQKKMPYASMNNTIRLCQRALIALLEFCTESDETNVLRREGLPIKSRQSLFYEMRFHRLLFDVIVAPFQLLHSTNAEVYGTYSSVVNSIAALMKSDHGSFDQIYETLRMAQHQQADLSCIWSGVWFSSAAASAMPQTNFKDSGEGLLDVRELMLPMHRELHLLTRLAVRLLRQSIRDNAATFTAGWSVHIPRLLQLDGLRLHVVDAMRELFTDNPYIPLRAVHQVLDHFISVSKHVRRGTYMDFLGAACTIKYKGVPERQAFVCQRLLVENPQSLCRFVIVVPPGKAESEGRVYILPNLDPDATTDSDREDPRKNNEFFAASHRRVSGMGQGAFASAVPFPSHHPHPHTGDTEADGDDGICAAPPPGYLPFTEFFSSKTDKKKVTFVSNQIALFARLCYDGCPKMCRDVVGRLFPPAAMKSLLRNFVWTGKQVVGNRCAHDALRNFLIRLAMQCFVLPRMSAPAVQLRVNTVLFGSSQLRQSTCPTYSGLPDDEMTLILKSVVVELLRANPFFVQDDTDRSLLMRGAVSVWLKLTRYQQYTHEEVLTVLPMLLQLLDGTRDVLGTPTLLHTNLPPTGAGVRSRRPTGPRAGSRNSFVLPSPLAAMASASVFSSRSTSRLARNVESVHLMRIREMICQALFLALQHEVFHAADNIIVNLYKAYTQPDTNRHDTVQSSSAAARVWGAVQQKVGDLTASRDGSNSGSSNEQSPLLGLYGSGSVTMSSGDAAMHEEEARKTSLAAQRQADGYHEIADSSQSSILVSGGAPVNAVLQGSEMFSASWTSQLIRTEASSAYAELSSSDDDENTLPAANGVSGGGDGKPGSGISAAGVQAILDYHTHRITEYFQPPRLVPYLFDIARYGCGPLTAQAMALLVQLCVVKRSIAQLVLKVNTLPSSEVLRSFDCMYRVAVQLKEVYENVAPGTPRATQWEPAIQFALDALNGQHPPPPLDIDADAGGATQKLLQRESGGGGEGGVSQRASLPSKSRHDSSAASRLKVSFRRMYRSFHEGIAEDVLPSDSDEESEGHEEVGLAEEGGAAAEEKDSGGTPDSEEASPSEPAGLNRQQDRRTALWSKTAGAVRMLAYNTAIRNRRRALGLSETSTIPVNVIVRAEMMAHWKIHESLLQMLSQLTLADPIFKSVLQFFYFFSFSESNSLLLQPYVKLFVDKLDPAGASDTVCLQIIVRILRSKPHVEDYLTPELLAAVAKHIHDELHTKLPDPELVEMLSEYIFSKSSLSPVVRRRMMILFREHGTLMTLARFRLNPTPAEVVFTSALVNLVCSICGSYTSVLTLARSMLPAENICNVILQNRIVESLPVAIVDWSRSSQAASSSFDSSTTLGSVAALKLLNPYVRILVALYFIPKNDTQDDNRCRCLLWMGNAKLWGIVKLFTNTMEAVSNAIEQDGNTQVVNRGLNGVKAYRTLLCSTIPVAMAGFFMNCFSNEGFIRFQSEVIEKKFYELVAAAERFGSLLVQHVATINLTVEEVVNYRRFLGVLCKRLVELNDPSAVDKQKLAERCVTTKRRMRAWLSEQQRVLESALVEMEDVRAGAMGSAAAAPGPRVENSKVAQDNSAASFSISSSVDSFMGLRKPIASTSATAAAYVNNVLRRKARTDDDISAFRLLFAEEAVSQAQLHSQEVLEAAGLGGLGARILDSPCPNREPEGADTSGFNNIGLLLPGVLASSRGVSAVRASLRATLHGDSIIPSVRRCPSEVSTIAVQRLLHSAHDECMRGSIVCILEAMRNHLFRPRTFVGVLNLFSNALDTALHYPDLVKALCGSGLTVWSDSAVSTPQTASPSLRVPAAVATKGFDGEGGAGVWNPDSTVAPESLGYALQSTFNDAGMLNVVISLCGLEEDVISLNAIRLGVLILEGGNRHAQSRLLAYFLTREEGFFHNVRDILRKNLSWVEHINAEHQYYLMKRGMHGEESKGTTAAANIQIINALTPKQNGGGTSAVDTNLEVFTASKSYVSSLHGEQRKWLATLRSATQVSGWARVRGSRRLKLITFLFRFLQLFCEGHFAGLQNYVRSQHDNLHSANVIIETMAFMEEMSTFVTPSNHRVLSQGFELLTEVCQGPCRLNQEALIDYGVCRVIRHLVDYLQTQSGGDSRELAALLKTISESSSLQQHPPHCKQFTRSQDDKMEAVERDVMNQLGESEAAQLRVSISNTLLAVLEGCREVEAYRRVLRQIPLTSVAVEVQDAFNPATIHLLHHDEDAFEKDDRMEAMFNWLIFLKSVEPYAELEGVLEGVQTLLRSSEAVSRYLSSIEVRRADGLERVHFRIPLICQSLTQERKDELLWSVDRTSRATKLADFLHKSDAIIFAVERNHAFHKHVARWTRFAITYYDEAARARQGGLRRSVRSMKLFYNNYVAAKLFPYELAAYDMVSMTLAVLSNSILVVLKGGDSSSKSTVQVYGDRLISVLCALQVVVCSFMFLVYLNLLFPIHLYNVYKNKQRFTVGKVRINVALEEVYTNLTVRERWGSFLGWFDMQFRITLLFFAILSYIVSHYFAAFNLMLAVYSIPTLRTFISAITMNGKQLLLTSFMGIIMLYLFSIVGFLVFANQYNPDGGEAGSASTGQHMNCESLLQCFAYILDQGLRAGGGVGDVMLPWTWDNSRMLARLAYDMLFYALVTVVFLNILFGLIIDTFGQMRDEKREKEADMHGFCSICGLDADTLEKNSVMGFANHVKQEHNMWMYLYFIHHLRRKDSSEYTGQESYVSACIQRSGLSFFPEGNCISLIEQRRLEGEELNALEEDDEDTANNDGKSDETVDAAARLAMKELTAARETISAHIKEWQNDSMRMKALLQQLELTLRSAAMTGTNAAGQGCGAVSVRSGQTLPRSAKAETIIPSDAAAMEMQTMLEYSSSSNIGGLLNPRLAMESSTSLSGAEAPGLRAVQAQLQAERELRQRCEQERRKLKAALKAKETELTKLKMLGSQSNDDAA